MTPADHELAAVRAAAFAQRLAFGPRRLCTQQPDGTWLTETVPAHVEAKRAADEAEEAWRMGR